MKRMWRDNFFLEERLKNQESRLFSSVLGGRDKEQRCLLNGIANWTSIEKGLNSFATGVLRHFKTPYSLLTILLTTLALLMGSCNSDVEQSAKNQQYTCAMHPQIVEDEPGSCPICGMDLTPIRGKHQATHSADSLLAIGNNLGDSAETIIVKQSALAPEITLSGNITYNPNQVRSISARVTGRIEKSYVKYNFERVKKGQLLLKVYSPELVAIQQELLFLKSRGDTDLMNKTKSKLSLLGVSTTQINQVIKSGKADYTINIYSNYSGYLLNPESNNETVTQSANNPLNVREGAYINSGDLLFKVFNDNSLWAEFYTNASGSEWLKKGNTISLKIGDKTLNSKINFVQPIFKDNQNFKVIRVVLNNQNHQYRIGELATANVKHSDMEGIWISQQAIYQSGEKDVVFIKTPTGLEAKKVQVSAKANDQFLIVKGLTAGDEIAKNASYLKDSESFINSK